MMRSISTMPDRIERAISFDSAPPPRSPEERRFVAILMPPRGFRISWATPAAISPERGELLALDEPPLGLDLLGEIAQHADRADDLPVGVEDAAHRQVGGEGLALGRARGHLPAPALPRLDGGRDGLGRAAALLGAEEILEADAAEPALAVAEEPLTGRIHRDEPAIHAGGEDAVVDALDHRGQQPLAPANFLLGQPQRLLHLLEGGDELLRLVLGDREVVLHDHARRGGAEGGGEQPLEPDAQLEQLRHRQLRRRLAAEELAHDTLGLRVAHVVVHEALDLGRRQDGRGAGRLPVLPRRADEGRGLGAIVGVLLGDERHQHEEREVDEERPEDPVGDRCRGRSDRRARSA